MKVTELKKEHTGQIMTYMNYIDKNIKTIEENRTVGIIICKKDNKYVIEDDSCKVMDNLRNIYNKDICIEEKINQGYEYIKRILNIKKDDKIIKK